VRISGLVTVLVIGAALIACSGSDEGGEEAGNGQQVGREEFGMTEAELVSAIERTESAIADCMREAGFEYTPIDPVTFRVAMNAHGTAQGLSDEEYIAQYGYGISTLPPSGEFGAGEANAAVFNALSAADQVAYQRTLLGDNLDATFVNVLEAEDVEPTGGCTRTAIEQTFTAEQLDPTFFNPFDAQVQADPRWIEAVGKWSSCMRDEGFDFANPDAAEASITERLDAITEGSDPATLEGPAREALVQLQGEERAIAAADASCQEEHLADVEEEIEQELSGRS